MVIMQFEIRGVRYADENEAKKILEELYTSGNENHSFQSTSRLFSISATVIKLEKIWCQRLRDISIPFIFPYYRHL
ncbi:MAG: hypothetical protein WBV72_06785 [Nitrososphaeraceae archaeon]